MLMGLPHLQEALRKEAHGVTAQHRAAAPSWAPGVAVTRGKARHAAHGALPPRCREAVQHSPALPSTTGPAPPRPPSPRSQPQHGLTARPKGSPTRSPGPPSPGPAQPPAAPGSEPFSPRGRRGPELTMWQETLTASTQELTI